MHSTRSTDDRRQRQRRGGGQKFIMGSSQWQEPSWGDQRLQFTIRYLFAALGLIYFNFFFDYTSSWMSLSLLNGIFFFYYIWSSVLLWHASRNSYSPTRYRIAMWADVLMTSVVVLNDPFSVPITSLVYVVVVLGNGMRYGMRCFSEALMGSFLALMLTLTMRYATSFQELSPGIIFMNLFGAIIVCYAYILMSRIDASHRALEHNSRMDLLTGVLNRAALLEMADRLLDDKKAKLQLVFGDLDKFKIINDTRGHSEGDRCLAAVGEIIRSSVRVTDIAGRYGGDEFLLLLPSSSVADAQEIAERIQNRIVAWGRRLNIPLGISFGIASAPEQGRDLQTLLNQADRMLYQGKRMPPPVILEGRLQTDSH